MNHYRVNACAPSEYEVRRVEGNVLVATFHGEGAYKRAIAYVDFLEVGEACHGMSRLDSEVQAAKEKVGG